MAGGLKTQKEKLMKKTTKDLVKRGITTLKKMEAFKNAINNLKAALAENGLLEFVIHYRSLPNFTDAEKSKHYIKDTRELLKGLGNHAYNDWSDKQLLEREQKLDGLDNYQAKEEKFNGLMNYFGTEGSIGSRTFKELKEAGFYDDSILDALLEPERLSYLLATVEAVFRSLPLDVPVATK